MFTLMENSCKTALITGYNEVKYVGWTNSNGSNKAEPHRIKTVYEGQTVIRVTESNRTKKSNKLKQGQTESNRITK